MARPSLGSQYFRPTPKSEQILISGSDSDEDAELADYKVQNSLLVKQNSDMNRNNNELKKAVEQMRSTIAELRDEVASLKSQQNQNLDTIKALVLDHLNHVVVAIENAKHSKSGNTKANAILKLNTASSSAHDMAELEISSAGNITPPVGRTLLPVSSRRASAAPEAMTPSLATSTPHAGRQISGPSVEEVVDLPKGGKRRKPLSDVTNRQSQRLKTKLRRTLSSEKPSLYDLIDTAELIAQMKAP